MVNCTLENFTYLKIVSNNIKSTDQLAFFPINSSAMNNKQIAQNETFFFFVFKLFKNYLNNFSPSNEVVDDDNTKPILCYKHI